MRMRQYSVPVLALALVLLGGLARPAAGDAFGERSTLDVLEIQLVGRDLLAIDGRGGTPTERLQIGETVHWRGTRGRVGVVLTDRRILAVSTHSAGWQSERYRRAETPPTEALLGEQVAVLLSSKRLFALDGLLGPLSVTDLGPQERVLATELGANVALIATNRRALGTAPRLGGFVEIRLTPQEGPFETSVTGNVATILTKRRLLTFRGPAGSWGERRRKLR